LNVFWHTGLLVSR